MFLIVIAPVIVLFWIDAEPEVMSPLMLLFVIVDRFPAVILAVMVLSVTVDESPTAVSFVSWENAIMVELVVVIVALE